MKKNSEKISLSDLEPHRVPIETINFGKIINPAILMAGDLILISAKKPKFISRQIQKFQRRVHPEEHAIWHHAIVATGNILICESIFPKGVVDGTYLKYMNGNYNLKIRRIKDSVFKCPEDMIMGKRTEIAVNAVTILKERYGIMAIPSMYKSIITANTFNSRNTSGFICSELYVEACLRANVAISCRYPNKVTPADLCSSNRLDDVPIQWAKLTQ